MGSAWYPRGEVEALRRPAPARRPRPRRRPAAGPTTRSSPSCARGPHGGRPGGRRGVSISRAERVYRFWLAHEDAVAAARGPGPSEPPERRSAERIEHDDLIRQLRDADPNVRAAAFEKLKSRAGPGRS